MVDRPQSQSLFDANLFARTGTNGMPELIASRTIRKGVELTYDYAQTELVWSPGAEERTIKCRCGSESCTGRILAFSDLTAEAQQRLAQLGRCLDYLVSIVQHPEQVASRDEKF